jgi:HD-GYP domain-containing protein (c-di-GMP phosphodiesterase class II)
MPVAGRNRRLDMLSVAPRTAASRGSVRYTFFMAQAGMQLATLLERSPRACRSQAGSRTAIEFAVAELVDALRSHHTGTADHSNRLAADCRSVGQELELGPEVLFELDLVAILHDIGKLAVPAGILDLPRPLNERERAIVRAHTIHGAEILAEIAGLSHLAPLVRASHERWDGTGYPDRLAGEQIPRLARIVFTVDAYDAMTNHRPYRRALGRAEARRRIAAGVGSAFDPHVVRALLAAL